MATLAGLARWLQQVVVVGFRAALAGEADN